jgi:hypothetical protein
MSKAGGLDKAYWQARAEKLDREIDATIEWGSGQRQKWLNAEAQLATEREDNARLRSLLAGIAEDCDNLLSIIREAAEPRVQP